MSSSRRISDVIGMLRGLQKVATSFGETQYKSADRYWRNSSLNQIPSKVGEKMEQTVSSAVVKQAELQAGLQEIAEETMEEKMERVNRLIPAELQMPPAPTEADIAELARDIEALGYMSGERTAVLKTAHVEHSPGSKESKSSPHVSGSRLDTRADDKMSKSHKSNGQDINHQLSSKSRESKVPSGRVARVVSFGSLAAGLGAGALAEMAKRSLGLSNQAVSTSEGGTDSKIGSSPFLSDANMERIVATLCRVRGAALKLGQMLSIQDNSLLNPQLQAAFERVRQSADFMPLNQMEKVMSSELGHDWRSKFADFDDKPFAAASIGQVHRAVLHDGQAVAVKVQYPGVAKSINSDINNLLSILKVWQILPKGMYVENVMDFSRKELAWECDYLREAKCMEVFSKLLEGNDKFVVPRVYNSLSTRQVLVTELIPGVPLDKCADLSQETRNRLGKDLLELSLTELYVWNVMQTDPNWSNFFYDSSDGKVYLLDFGATRQYSRRFVDTYIDIIKAAAVNDRETILEKSDELGFFTGYESKDLYDAHVAAVSVLGGPCGKDEIYNFGSQDITGKIENMIPKMLKNRLSPPPEETYSLHRKLGGTFLLCTRLKSQINVKRVYDPIFANYKYGLPDQIYDLDPEPE